MIKTTRSAGFVLLMFVGCLGLGMNALAAPSDNELHETLQKLRLNQIQLIGVHNAYHIAIPDAEFKLWLKQAGRDVGMLNVLDYTHPPLNEQLNEGIRHFELDVWRDENGGRFSNPLTFKLLGKEGSKARSNYDPENKLSKPGYKVLHNKDFDIYSQCLVFTDCLREIKTWSQENQNHFPVMLQIEVKGELAKTPAEEQKAWQELEAEILSVFPAEQIIRPDDVRGNGVSLNETITTKGWPMISAVSGKVMFMLDNTDRKMKSYMGANNNLENKILFVSAPPGHPSSAWLKMNDPYNADIPTLVAKGYLIRTRSDANTMQSRLNDVVQRDTALKSGAQFISSDYPTADSRFSNYQVNFGSKRYWRCNPITAKHCDGYH